MMLSKAEIKFLTIVTPFIATAPTTATAWLSLVAGSSAPFVEVSLSTLMLSLLLGMHESDDCLDHSLHFNITLTDLVQSAV